MTPELAELLEPVVDLAERLGLQGVDPAGSGRRTRAKPVSRSTRSCWETAGWLIPNSAEITVTTSPAACSPSARTSRIRRRTGSPSTSSACTRLTLSIPTYISQDLMEWRPGRSRGALGHVAAHLDGLAAVLHRAPAPAAVLGLVEVEPRAGVAALHPVQRTGDQQSQAAYAPGCPKASSASAARSGARGRRELQAAPRRTASPAVRRGSPAPARAPRPGRRSHRRRRSRPAAADAAGAVRPPSVRALLSSCGPAPPAARGPADRPAPPRQRGGRIVQMVELRRQTGLVDGVGQVQSQVAADDQQRPRPGQKCFHQNPLYRS